MNTYATLYENLILRSWGQTKKRSDPFRLGDADTFILVDFYLDDRNGHEAKFGLSSAIMKVANQYLEHYNHLITLDEELWRAKTIEDLYKIIDELKVIFTKIGI